MRKGGKGGLTVGMLSLVSFSLLSGPGPDVGDIPRSRLQGRFAHYACAHAHPRVSRHSAGFDVVLGHPSSSNMGSEWSCDASGLEGRHVDSDLIAHKQHLWDMPTLLGIAVVRKQRCVVAFETSSAFDLATFRTSRDLVRPGRLASLGLLHLPWGGGAGSHTFTIDWLRVGCDARRLPDVDLDGQHHFVKEATLALPLAARTADFTRSALKSCDCTTQDEAREWVSTL